MVLSETASAGSTHEPVSYTHLEPGMAMQVGIANVRVNSYATYDKNDGVQEMCIRDRFSTCSMTFLRTSGLYCGGYHAFQRLP